LQRQRLQTVLDARPVCFNHNLETVERLQGEVRRGATYRRSLGLLAAARDGIGEELAFLERWGYDEGQRAEIVAALESVAE
jgi:lipoate synthase